jgi:hypothetical protein
MTIPVSNTTVASAYSQIWNSLINLRGYCQAVQANTTGGAATQLLTFLQVAKECVTYRSLIAALTANTTLLNAVVTYANQQAAVANLTSTDFANANTAAGNILTAITTEYPHDAQGRLLDRTFSTTTGEIWATATAAQAPLTMSAITAFLATIS